MTLSTRIARHLRTHIVGYLALFVALSGTAIALPGKHKVKGNDLAKHAVEGRALATGAVGAAKLRAGSVTAAAIADRSVVTADLADGAVNTSKLTDEAVSRAKIAAGSINGGKLANGAVSASKVNDGSLLAQDFAPGELSAGFAAEQSSTTFNLPRGGKLFVTATFLSNCPVASCSYSVEVDNTPVTGTALSGNLDDQVTLTGVSDAVAAGNRTLEINVTGATITEPTIAAVLLQ